MTFIRLDSVNSGSRPEKVNKTQTYLITDVIPKKFTTWDKYKYFNESQVLDVLQSVLFFIMYIYRIILI